jgi:tRNA1(Val) A37 N6-methylase TrmN6
MASAGAAAGGAPDVLAAWPVPGEDLCHLAGDWRILQRLDGHRWSLDDLVTAWFAAASVGVPPPARIADLGCGIGAVLLLLAWRFPHARVVGVEAQAVSVELARRSLLWNGAGDRCTVHQGDLRDPAVLAAEPPFALVTGTPPYLRPGAATESRRVQWAACHVEHRGGVEAYCAAAARLLAPDGWFVTCHAAAPSARVADAAAAVGLAVVRRREVVPREGKRVLFAVSALRPVAVAAPPVVEPPLVVRDRRGRRTAELVRVRRAFGMPP